MELADLPGHPARAITRKHKRAVEDRLAGVLGSRRAAVDLVLLLEGAMVMLLIHGERGYAEAAAGAAKRLIAAGGAAPRRTRRGLAAG